MATGKITLSPFTATDLTLVDGLLSDWVIEPKTGEVDRERIVRIKDYVMQEPLVPGDRVYLLAKDEAGKIVGMIGYKAPCNYMQSFCDTQNAAEIINFYTTNHFADTKIADAILTEVEGRIKNEGGIEIVINRAPRYSNEVESYLNQRAGYEHVGVAEDFFGESFDAPVWVKRFDK